MGLLTMAIDLHYTPDATPPSGFVQMIERSVVMDEEDLFDDVRIFAELHGLYLVVHVGDNGEFVFKMSRDVHAIK